MKAGQYRHMAELEGNYWWFLAKRTFAESVLPKMGEDMEILDVGCGTGGMTEFMNKYGNVLGIEPASEAHPFLKKGKIKYISSTFEKYQSKKKFDLICFFDVLYHRDITDDREVLAKANRLLKPGGYLLITDCALPFLMGPHDTIMHARQRYRLTELKDKVTEAGFTIQRSSYTYMITFPLFITDRLIQKITKTTELSTIPEFLNKVLLKLCVLESWFLRFINLPIGSSIIILARQT